MEVNSLQDDRDKILFGSEHDCDLDDDAYASEIINNIGAGSWDAEGDIDNLWNQEGFFEDASDQGWYSPYGYEI